MAKVNVDGVEHSYPANPTLEGEVWEVQYPPLPDDAPYLRCKTTGQIYPNFPEFAERSDILEPYYGELTNVAKNTKPVPPVNDTLEVLEEL